MKVFNRPAVEEDIHSILEIIRPLEEEGILVISSHDKR
jgi:N-acetylglutamate synthase-like GNAT family acetyltransferase